MKGRQSTGLRTTEEGRGLDGSGIARVHYAAGMLKQEALQIWGSLGQEALLSGDIEEALWYFRRVVELDARVPVVWQLLGRCFEEMGDEPRARDCYRLASRLLARGSTPTHWDADSLSLLWDFPEPHEV